MAYIRKRGKAWFAEVERAGQRAARSFPRKAEAEAWAVLTEQQFLASKRGELPRQTVLDALDRYEKECSSKKRGFAWEVKRIAAIAPKQAEGNQAASTLYGLRRPWQAEALRRCLLRRLAFADLARYV